MSSQMRLAGREHIPHYPPGFVTLPILQLIISVAVIGLSAYTLSYWAFVGNCLSIFTAVVTLIVTIWITSALTCAPRGYNYWAYLAFIIFLYVFWIVSFALMAVDTAAYFSVGTTEYCDDYDDYCSTYTYTLNDAEKIYGGVMGGMAGLGAVEFLLFKISLIIHAVVVYRHRRAGLHNRPVPVYGNNASASPAGGAPIPMQVHQPDTKIAGNTYYQAVPQQHQNMGPQAGYPPMEQNTAYNPHQSWVPPYNGAPQQQQQQQQSGPNSAHQSYYGGAWQPGQQPQQQSPIAPQATGGSYQQHSAVGTSPSPNHQGPYQAPTNEHQQHQPYPQPQQLPTNPN